MDSAQNPQLYSKASYGTPPGAASDLRSLAQTARQSHSLVQRRLPTGRIKEQRNNRAHKEGSCGLGHWTAWASVGYPNGSCREESCRACGSVRGRRKEKKWARCVADDIRMFEIRDDWRTAASEPLRTWYVWHSERGAREGSRTPPTTRTTITPSDRDREKNKRQTRLLWHQG